MTSTYYMDQLPEWVVKFNTGPRIAQAVKEAGLDDTTQFYNMVGRTPAANGYELDFAKALIENEKLGQGAVTDVLTVSLSANDILGHQMGPDSDDEKQMVLGLDRDINAFFTWLDAKVGLKNVTVAFTADHGIAPIPGESAKLGVASARLELDKFGASIDAALNKQYSPGMKKEYLMLTQELPYIQLGIGGRFRRAVTEKEAEQAVVDAVPVAVAALGASAGPPNNNTILEADRKYSESRAGMLSPKVAFVRSRVDLADGKIPATQFGELIAHSYTADFGWYVMVVPTAYQMEFLNGIQTTHFSPWSYDRHVPLGFYGADFVPGYYRQQVAPVDIATTLASLLGVNAPSAAVGHVLTFALKPAR